MAGLSNCIYKDQMHRFKNLRHARYFVPPTVPRETVEGLLVLIFISVLNSDWNTCTFNIVRKSVSLVKKPEISFMGLSSSLKSFSISAPLHRPCGGWNRIFSPLCQWEASWERSTDWIVGRWADAAVGGSLYVCESLRTWWMRRNTIWILCHWNRLWILKWSRWIMLRGERHKEKLFLFLHITIFSELVYFLYFSIRVWIREKRQSPIKY